MVNWKYARIPNQVCTLVLDSRHETSKNTGDSLLKTLGGHVPFDRGQEWVEMSFAFSGLMVIHPTIWGVGGIPQASAKKKTSYALL